MDVLFLSFEFNFYSNILIEYQNRAVRDAPSRIPRWTEDDSNRVSDLENHKITKKHKEIHQKKDDYSPPINTKTWKMTH